MLTVCWLYVDCMFRTQEKLQKACLGLGLSSRLRLALGFVVWSFGREGLSLSGSHGPQSTCRVLPRPAPGNTSAPPVPFGNSPVSRTLFRNDLRSDMPFANDSASQIRSGDNLHPKVPCANDPASQVSAGNNLHPNVVFANDSASQVLSEDNWPPSSKLKLSFVPGLCIPRTPSDQCCLQLMRLVFCEPVSKLPILIRGCQGGKKLSLRSAVEWGP